MFNSYKNALIRLNRQIEPLTQYYGKSKFFFFFHAFLDHIRYGVTPNQYIGYRFFAKSPLEKERFYTFRHTKKYEALLNDSEYSCTFWDKPLFNKTFHDFVHRDWLLCEEGCELSIKKFIESHKKIIVKPVDLSSGRGIHVYAGDNIDDLIWQHCLLEEFVNQSLEMNKLNPSSVNTIRIYTILDSKSIPHILSASLRVGGKGSDVDNYHSGGVGYPIDVETGVIKSAGADIMGIRHLYHPSTGVKVIGFEIPHWKECVEFVQRACFVVPVARLIAWDVAILENGFEMIEGNYEGDPGLMQAPSGEGLLKKIIEFAK